jgi:hypothetical protein
MLYGVVVETGLVVVQASRLVSHMQHSIFPAATEWDVVSEQQIYFIVKGANTLSIAERTNDRYIHGLIRLLHYFRF